jgi:hypothetical protein
MLRHLYATILNTKIYLRLKLIECISREDKTVETVQNMIILPKLDNVYIHLFFPILHTIYYDCCWLLAIGY